jgi:hypothetical protein
MAGGDLGPQYVRNPSGHQYIPSAQNTVKSSIGVMTNGDTVFTVSGGPIRIEELVSVCVTANAATATTMQWSSTPTVGSAATFSGASAALTSATAGTTVRVAPTALTTALVVVAASAGGVQLGTNVANRIVVKDGIITLVIATGPTTGTWQHFLTYTPLTPDSTVS